MIILMEAGSDLRSKMVRPRVRGSLRRRFIQRGLETACEEREVFPSMMIRFNLLFFDPGRRHGVQRALVANI